MYYDNALEVASALSVIANPAYTASIDLSDGIGVGGTSAGIISPDLGSGNGIVAVIKVLTYDKGLTGTTGTTFNIVTSSISTLLSSTKVVGSSGLIAETNLELLASTSAPLVPEAIVVRINPDHWSALDVAAGAGRYLGIQIVHATAPDAMTITASFADNFQGRPEAFHHASGFSIS